MEDEVEVARAAALASQHAAREIESELRRSIVELEEKIGAEQETIKKKEAPNDALWTLRGRLRPVACILCPGSL